MPEDAPHAHRSYAPKVVRCFVLTVSDRRGAEDDASGDAIAERMEAAGHRVTGRRLVPDEVPAIRAAVTAALADEEVDAVLVTGGTGAAPRDRTPEAVEPLLDRRLEGFGELFRMLSYQEIGAAAMLSRATAGTAGRRAVFLLPGSVAAVRLAVERLVVPELPHLLGQLRRSAEPGGAGGER